MQRLANRLCFGTNHRISGRRRYRHSKRLLVAEMLESRQLMAADIGNGCRGQAACHCRNGTFWSPTRRRHRIAVHHHGDFNEDGFVDQHDISALCAEIRSGDYDVRFDLNFDGSLDSSDLDAMIYDVIGTKYGDANLDFVVDGQDFVAWLTKQVHGQRKLGRWRLQL